MKDSIYNKIHTLSMFKQKNPNSFCGIWNNWNNCWRRNSAFSNFQGTQWASPWEWQYATASAILVYKLRSKRLVKLKKTSKKQNWTHLNQTYKLQKKTTKNIQHQTEATKNRHMPKFKSDSWLKTWRAIFISSPAWLSLTITIHWPEAKAIGRSGCFVADPRRKMNIYSERWDVLPAWYPPKK